MRGKRIGGQYNGPFCIRTANERDNIVSRSGFLSSFFAAGRIMYCSFYAEMPGNAQETQIILDMGMVYTFGE